MDTLAFGYILPTTGWILDLHQLETCAAERTSKKRVADAAALFSCSDSQIWFLQIF